MKRLNLLTSGLAFLMVIPSFVYAQFPGGVGASSTNELWLDAYQLSQTVNDNAIVTQWNDFSGNNNHAIEPIALRRPIMRHSGINGMPAIDFDGSNDYMYVQANSGFNSNQSTHFVVYERSTVNSGANCLFNMDFNEGSNLIFTATFSTYSQSYVKNSAGQPRRLFFGASTNQILSATWNGTSGTYSGFMNGVAQGPIFNAANTATGHKLVRIGSFNTNYKFNGNIAEVIYYTSVLNAAERNIVENYLAAKYQITVSNSLYSHQATHRHDVIGIGREGSGSNLTASGTSNMDITASSMNIGDYVLAGHDDGGYAANSTDVPSGYNRYNQVWRSTVTNYGGTVDISFDVSTLGLGNDTAYKLLVDGDGVFATGATEYPGVFAGGIVTFSGVPLASGDFFTLANSDFQVVSTGVTNDWHLTTTWTCGCVPGLGTDATILTGHNVFINGQNAQVGALTVDGSLTFNSTDTLQMNGNLTNNNIINAGSGTFTFTGASLAQSITGAVTMNNMTLDNSLGLTINTSLSVQGWLKVEDGVLTTNNALTLLSNASGTAAYIGYNPGDISGDFTVERFLDEGEGWYLLAPVVSGGDLEDWNQEFEMQGFTGTEWPGGISSVYYYDQSGIINNFNQGYAIPTSTFDVIDPKVGYEIYVGDDTYASGARTIDITGTPVLGAVAYSCPHQVQSGDPSQDGWSLITNPYAAPVKFGAIIKSGSFDAGYRRKNDGSNVLMNNQWILASGEAFWIHSNSGGSTLTFQGWMPGFDGLINDTYNQRSVTQEEDPILDIKLSYTYNSVQEENITYLGFSDQATNLKDDGLDAYKLNNVYGDKPNLSTVNDGKDMEQNILAMNSTDIIPINIKEDYPSTTLENYTLSFEHVEDLLMKNKILVLEDRELGIFTDLTGDTAYAFTMMDTVTQPRFFLHVTSPLTVAHENVSCFGMNDGKLFADGFANDAKDYVWKDELDNVIASNFGVTGADSIANLAPGTYTVEVTNTVSSDVVSNTFVVNEPLDVTTAFYTMYDLNDDVDVTSSTINDTLTAYTNNTISFESASLNASVYSWDFGDLSVSSLENPTHMYFNPGLYKVELRAGNGNCEKVAEQYLNVINSTGIDETNLLDEVIVYNDNNELFLTFNGFEMKNYTVSVFNSIGQVVVNKTISAGQNQRERITLENASGVYIVKIDDGDSSKSKKIIINKE